MEKLIEFITDNIYQFRNILEAKESYYYEIPAITSKNSDNLDVPEPTKVNLNQSVDMQAQDKQVDFSEDVFPVVPGTMKANKSTMPRNVNTLSPMQMEQSPSHVRPVVRVDKVVDNKDAARA